MEFEIKKKVKREVEETVKVELFAYWVVRLIRNSTNKTCVYEKRFTYEPTEQEIASVIIESRLKNVFATVNKNYEFVEKN